MHPLNKLDIFLEIDEGVTRDVIALHDTKRLPLLRVKLAEHGISVEEDTSIPKKDRPKWAVLAKKAGLPQEWWMVEDEPQDLISTL